MLKEEIWGCFKHIGIPMETVMRLPIQDRRFYIQKHNSEVEAYERKTQGSSNEMTYQGESLNNFARNQTEYKKNSGLE